MATDNDITQDETLDEDLVPVDAESLPRPPTPAPVDAESLPRPPTTAPVDAESLPRPPATSPVDAESLPRPPNAPTTPARPPANDARYLSEREAAELRKVYGDPKAKRIMRRLMAVGVLALILGSAFAFQWLRTEKTCTWPGAESNQIDDGEETITLDGKEIALVYFPHVPGYVLNRQDGGNLEVYSCVGKFRNVPFRLAFSSRKLVDGYRRTLEQSFADYSAACKRMGVLQDATTAKKDYLRQETGYGFPVMRALSLRRVNGQTWMNHVIYFRYLDWECVLERGCLANEYRAVSLMKEVDCLVVYRSTAREHFAIPARRMSGTTDQLLRKARAGMSQNMDVSDWREIDGALRTLLTIAHETDNRNLLVEAADAWEDWRRNQADWFALKNFAYAQAYQNEDQSACCELRRLGVERFDGTDDARSVRGIGAEWGEN